VLVEKTIAAARLHGAEAVSMAGGVSANSRLRTAMGEACRRNSLELFVPDMAYSTDNAAMIATMAGLMISRGRVTENRYDAAPFARFVTTGRGAH
jgi:N6-L-threonylcarbamoyladenine synthase